MGTGVVAVSKKHVGPARSTPTSGNGRYSSSESGGGPAAAAERPAAGVSQSPVARRRW